MTKHKLIFPPQVLSLLSTTEHGANHILLPAPFSEPDPSLSHALSTSLRLLGSLTQTSSPSSSSQDHLWCPVPHFTAFLVACHRPLVLQAHARLQPLLGRDHALECEGGTYPISEAQK